MGVRLGASLGAVVAVVMLGGFNCPPKQLPPVLPPVSGPPPDAEAPPVDAAARAAGCGVGQPCCEGDLCTGRAVCSAGQCVACGDTGQPCCESDAEAVCPPRHLCYGADGSSATCQRCGGPDEPCCGDGACGSAWQVCDREASPWTCRSCGAMGGRCCEGETREEQCQQPDGGMIAVPNECTESSGSLACSPCGVPTGGGMARCRPPVTGCGTEGGRCCVSGAPCGRGLGCHVGSCVRCGGPGQACCLGAMPCSLGLRCGAARRCEPGCGRIGQPCCGRLCGVGRCLGGVCRR